MKAVVPGSFEGFLAGEQDAERRHELVGGRIYAMSGGTERHDLIAGLIYEALVAGAKAKGCRPFMGNRLVRTREGSATTPTSWWCAGRRRRSSTRPIRP